MFYQGWDREPGLLPKPCKTACSAVGCLTDWWGVCRGNAHIKSGGTFLYLVTFSNFLYANAHFKSDKLVFFFWSWSSTMYMSTQDICSTEPLAHVDFYPNGGLSQVLSNCSSKWWWLLIIIDELIVIDEYWRFWSQVCGVGSCSCSSGASVCGSCYHGLAIDNDILYKRWWFWWWWYQESPWSKCQNHNHDEDNDHSITMMWNIRKTPMHRRLGLGRKSRQGSWTL